MKTTTAEPILLRVGRKQQLSIPLPSVFFLRESKGEGLVLDRLTASQRYSGGSGLVCDVGIGDHCGMTTSTAQVIANRANALRSTGPKSSEGRGASALNARKHGLRSETVPLLPNEDRGEWEALLTALRNEWLEDDAAASATEELLIARMAAAEWKRRRCEHFEIGVLAMEGCNDVGVGMAAWRDANKSQALGLCVRYRRAAETAFVAAMHELERVQARRKGAVVPLPVAVDVNVTSDLGGQRQPDE